MKEFEVELDEIEKTDCAYLVYGKSVGSETIAIGDFLNDLEVVKIESYGHEVDKCPSGLTARLTLSFKFREGYGDRADYLFLSLSEYKREGGPEKRE